MEAKEEELANACPFVVGDRVVVAGKPGTVKFAGQAKFAAGAWVGVALDAAVGKNDGCVQGEQYFICKPDHGVFVRPLMVTVLPPDKDPLNKPAQPKPKARADTSPTKTAAKPAAAPAKAGATSAASADASPKVAEAAEAAAPATEASDSGDAGDAGAPSISVTKLAKSAPNIAVTATTPAAGSKAEKPAPLAATAASAPATTKPAPSIAATEPAPVVVDTAGLAPSPAQETLLGELQAKLREMQKALAAEQRNTENEKQRAADAETMLQMLKDKKSAPAGSPNINLNEDQQFEDRQALRKARESVEKVKTVIEKGLSDAVVLQQLQQQLVELAAASQDGELDFEAQLQFAKIKRGVAEARLEDATLELTDLELQLESNLDQRLHKVCRGNHIPEKVKEYQEALRYLHGQSKRGLAELHQYVSGLERSIGNVVTLRHDQDELSIKQDDLNDKLVELEARGKGLEELCDINNKLETTTSDVQSELQSDLDQCTGRVHRLEALIKQLSEAWKEADQSIKDNTALGEELFQQLRDNELGSAEGSALFVRARMATAGVVVKLADVEADIAAAQWHAYQGIVPEKWVPSDSAPDVGRQSLKLVHSHITTVAALDSCLSRANALVSYVARTRIASASTISPDMGWLSQLCLTSCKLAGHCALTMVRLHEEGDTAPASALTLATLAGKWCEPDGDVWTLEKDGKALLKDEQQHDLKELHDAKGVHFSRADGWQLDKSKSSSKHLVWQKAGETEIVWKRQAQPDLDIGRFAKVILQAAQELNQLFDLLENNGTLEEKVLKSISEVEEGLSFMHDAAAVAGPESTMIQINTAFELRRLEVAYCVGMALLSDGQTAVEGEPPEKLRSKFDHLSRRLQRMSHWIQEVNTSDHTPEMLKNQKISLPPECEAKLLIIEGKMKEGQFSGGEEAAVVRLLHQAMDPVHHALDHLEKIPEACLQEEPQTTRRGHDADGKTYPKWVSGCIKVQDEFRLFSNAQTDLEEADAELKTRRVSFKEVQAKLETVTARRTAVHKDNTEFTSKKAQREVMMNEAHKLRDEVRKSADTCVSLQREMEQAKRKREVEERRANDILNKKADLETTLESMKRRPGDDSRATFQELTTLAHMRTEGSRELYDLQVQGVSKLKPLPLLGEHHAPDGMGVAMDQMTELRQGLLYEWTKAKAARVGSFGGDVEVEQQLTRIHQLQMKAAHVRKAVTALASDKAAAKSKPPTGEKAEHAACMTLEMLVPPWAGGIEPTTKLNLDFSELYSLHSYMLQE
mmetsp:Transcript_41084/g.132137  ORF Transcript_41084/g.132137 Transcript_41084/m.132137 type:complete len:1266 (-) Transcript_41084:185-3982(-)